LARRFKPTVAVIVAPFDDSPAQQAGLLRDAILINGEEGRSAAVQ
jgi:hypothetical protein